MSAFNVVFVRDLRVAFRRWSELGYPLIFFIIVATMFPLALSPTTSQLREVGTGVLWVAAFLSSLLAVDGLFRSDADDGSLEQLLLSPVPMTLTVLAKLAAHALVTLVPLILLVPVTALSYNMPLVGIADSCARAAARSTDAERIGRRRCRAYFELTPRGFDRRAARVAIDGPVVDLRHACD